MKALMASALLFLAQPFLFSQNSGEELQIQIDGSTYDIRTDEVFTFISPSGDSVKFIVPSVGLPVMVVEQETPSIPSIAEQVRYEDDLLAFDHPNHFSIASNSITADIHQLTMVTGNGDMVIIQEYFTLDPTSLIDFHFSGLTNQASGQNAVLNIENGQLRGKKVMIDDQETQVLAFGKGDNGILVTIVKTSETNMIEDFLGSLSVK